MTASVSNALLKKLNARYEKQAVKKLDEHLERSRRVIVWVCGTFLASYLVVSLIRSIFE